MYRPYKLPQTRMHWNYAPSSYCRMPPIDVDSVPKDEPVQTVAERRQFVTQWSGDLHYAHGLYLY